MCLYICLISGMYNSTYMYLHICYIHIYVYVTYMCLYICLRSGMYNSTYMYLHICVLASVEYNSTVFTQVRHIYGVCITFILTNVSNLLSMYYIHSYIRVKSVECVFYTHLHKCQICSVCISYILTCIKSVECVVHTYFNVSNLLNGYSIHTYICVKSVEYDSMLVTQCGTDVAKIRLMSYRHVSFFRKRTL